MWPKKVEYIRLALLTLCMTFAGCTYATYTSLVSDSFAPNVKDPEVLFVVPDRPFQIIGLMEARGAAGTTSPEVIESLKKKAKEKGAHAVYMYSYYEERQYGLFETYIKPRAYALALRYKEGNITETKKIIGRWIGLGTSTVVGEFTLVTTINENKGGISGVLTASTGLSGTIRGYIENNAVELLVFPSDPRYCILKFVGSYDGKDLIKGQYSSVFCAVSEGGMIEMKRSEATGATEQTEKPKIQDKREL